MFAVLQKFQQIVKQKLAFLVLMREDEICEEMAFATHDF